MPQKNGNKHHSGFSILVGCLHRTIILFSLFIGLFQRDKLHFSPQNAPQYPTKWLYNYPKTMHTRLEVIFFL